MNKIGTVFVMAVAHGITGVLLARALKEMKETL